MSLERILNPRAVAVVGASRTVTKRGYQALQALLDERFEGPVYPVNPSEDSILSQRCYRKVSDIEGPVDLVLITTPASTVAGIISDCAKKGVAGAVIIAGGFSEQGDAGRKLEGQVVAAAGDGGVRLVGPNTSGVLAPWSRLNIVGLKDVRPGNIALLSQSRNMALTLITEAGIKSRKGFSYYIGVGNEADIRFHEYLQFLEQDSRTRTIVIYVEGMRDGRRFLQQAYRTSRKKPIVLLKSGRSAVGKVSAGSHTGVLAGMSEVARTALRRAGIIVVENSDELFPAAETLSSLPPIANSNVVILADGGGHATIAADVLSESGVQMPPLGAGTLRRLRKILPDTAALHNPIDVAGGADANPGVLADCAKILLADDNVGGLLLVGLFGGYGIRFAKELSFVEEDAAHRMGKLVQETGKPIVVHSLYSFAKPHALDLLRYYNIPVYDSLEIACKCMSVLAEYGRYLETRPARAEFVFEWGQGALPRGREIIDGAATEGRGALLEPEAKELFRLHGAAVAEEELAADADEAVVIAKRLGTKVALKIVSPDILHKTEARGVELGLEGEEQIRAAFKRVVRHARAYNAQARIDGVLVSPMAEAGMEIIIGTKNDDQFGPVMLFGIGGIFAEVLKDVTFRVLPVTRRAAREMIDEIKSAELFKGFRGKPPADRKAILDLLMKVSEVMEAYPEIQELDLNPVIVHRKGLSVVDARVLLKPAGRKNSR